VAARLFERGAEFLYTLKNPAEIITLISAADAALAAKAAIRIASRRSKDRGMVRSRQAPRIVP
jgi:hypothetical protein